MSSDIVDCLTIYLTKKVSTVSDWAILVPTASGTSITLVSRHKGSSRSVFHPGRTIPPNEVRSALHTSPAPAGTTSKRPRATTSTSRDNPSAPIATKPGGGRAGRRTEAVGRRRGDGRAIVLGPGCSDTCSYGQEFFDRVKKIFDGQRGGGTRARVHHHYLKGTLWCCRRRRAPPQGARSTRAHDGGDKNGSRTPSLRHDSVGQGHRHGRSPTWPAADHGAAGHPPLPRSPTTSPRGPPVHVSSCSYRGLRR